MYVCMLIYIILKYNYVLQLQLHQIFYSFNSILANFPSMWYFQIGSQMQAMMR